MAYQTPDFPDKKEIKYYRGTTFKLTDSFFNIINDGSEPADLRPFDDSSSGIVVFEAHIKYNRFSAQPIVVIPHQYFQLGATSVPDLDENGNEQIENNETLMKDVYNLLNIEAPPHLFESIVPAGCIEMDVFQYYYTGGVLKHRCLRIYEITIQQNITNKEFE